MKGKSGVYIGITLTFVVRINRELFIQDASFLLRTYSVNDMLEKAISIGKKRSWGTTNSNGDFVQYLGTKDVFGVVGPFEDGAMMGQTSKLGYKTQAQTQRLIRASKDYTINMQDCDPAIDGLYIGRFIYFLGRPIPYKFRRAIVSWGIVKSARKSKLIDSAIRVAQSPKFKQKLILRDDGESFSTALLEFVGIANIIPVYEKLRTGNCFLYGSKKIGNLACITKIIFPDKRSFNASLREILRKGAQL